MSDPTSRRTPKQARSQRRVERVLAATQRLVGQRGNDAVSMREIAAEAGISVSSVYQYFPDNNALLRALILRSLQQVRATVTAALTPARTLDELVDAVPPLIDELAAMFERDTDLAAVWSGIQANAVLLEQDLADTRETARALADIAIPLVLDADPDEVYDMAFYIAHVAFFALRIAHHAPRDEAERLIREQKRVILLRLRSLR